MVRLKIAHLTSVHQHHDTRIFHKECKSLQQAGHEVVLIVPHEGDEQADGIAICAVPVPRSRLERIGRTVWQVYRAALQADAGVYHLHDPELIPVGFLLKASGKKVVYDVHEDLPRQILAKEWIPAWLRRGVSVLAEAVEGLAGKRFDGIVAATPTIARRFPGAAVVKNYPLLQELTRSSPLPYGQRPPLVSYIAAGITLQRGLREMVEAMGRMPGDSQARLILAGKLSNPALRHEPWNGWERVEEAGFLDRSGVQRLLSRTRIGLVVHHPLPNYVDSIPVKLFEYMGAGVPVIASRFPLWKEYVEGNRCGICVNPRDATEIAGAIQWLLEHPADAEQMGENGRRAVLAKYNWEREAVKLLNVYASISGANGNGQNHT